MTAPVPERPKIYHIVHWDRLPFIRSRGLWCDAVMAGQSNAGTTIGLSNIKRRRRRKVLNSRDNLRVGDCVPFYFCPRSVMLFVLHKDNNPDLAYHGGQEPIVHLEADLYRAINWSNKLSRRWAFTTSNAGAFDFEDYADVSHLDKIDWDAVEAEWWENTAELPNRRSESAEFLLEGHFPWTLIERIGVYSHPTRKRVLSALSEANYCPPVEVNRGWYYGGGGPGV